MKKIALAFVAGVLFMTSSFAAQTGQAGSGTAQTVPETPLQTFNRYKAGLDSFDTPTVRQSYLSALSSCNGTGTYNNQQICTGCNGTGTYNNQQICTGNDDCYNNCAVAVQGDFNVYNRNNNPMIANALYYNVFDNYAFIKAQYEFAVAVGLNLLTQATNIENAHKGIIPNFFDNFMGARLIVIAYARVVKENPSLKTLAQIKEAGKNDGMVQLLVKLGASTAQVNFPGMKPSDQFCYTSNDLLTCINLYK